MTTENPEALQNNAERLKEEHPFHQADREHIPLQSLFYRTRL